MCEHDENKIKTPVSLDVDDVDIKQALEASMLEFKEAYEELAK